MELSPGAGKALALIGLVPLAYKTHELEGALPSLAQKANELQIPAWLLPTPAVMLTIASVWLLRRLWEGRSVGSVVLAFFLLKGQWRVVSDLNETPSNRGFFIDLVAAGVVLAVCIGVWAWERRPRPTPATSVA